MVFDLQYFFATRFKPTRKFARELLLRVGTAGIMKAVVRFKPDVIVSTYPAATEVLGTLRTQNRLNVPLVSAITDLAALRFWAHPGCDLHLVTHSESEAEVRSIAGDDSQIVRVRGLTSSEFEQELSQDESRKALDLPVGRPVVLVSGGGWGVGDLEGAMETALRVDDQAIVVALCGRSDSVRDRLTQHFAEEERVRVVGFTDRMSDYMAAADVLVHSTAGLTVLEALIRGTRVISYGWGIAHIRLNNKAYQHFGLAEVAKDLGELQGALKRAISSPAEPDREYGNLPQAAELVYRLLGAPASDRSPARRRTRKPSARFSKSESHSDVVTAETE
jgi:UDP-N-acetylglucosamine:LPS N-acetylglucosamine transferase